MAMKPEALAEQKTMFSMIHGMWQSRCLNVVVGFKIPELLCNTEEESLSIEEIASKAGCSSTKQIYQIMTTLAQWGIGVELNNKQFAKNQAMEQLRRDKGPSMGHIVMFYCSEEMWKSLVAFPEAVRESCPAFILEHGINNFQYMNAIDSCKYDANKMSKCSFSEHLIGSDERRQEFVENYTLAMSTWSHLQTVLPGRNDVFAAFPWSTCDNMIDVGGGSGSFLASILKQPGCEHIQGFVADLPNVIEKAKADAHTLGVPDKRLVFLVQNFTEPLQPDVRGLQVDTIILKNVINMFGVDDVIKILKNCRSLLCQEKGRCLIVTSCTPEAGDTEHNVGENGIQWGFAQIHVMCLGHGLKISKSARIKYIREIDGQCGFKLSEIYETFSGGVTIFELQAI